MLGKLTLHHFLDSTLHLFFLSLSFILLFKSYFLWIEKSYCLWIKKGKYIKEFKKVCSIDLDNSIVPNAWNRSF